jgi:hypothetical protein
LPVSLTDEGSGLSWKPHGRPQHYLRADYRTGALDRHGTCINLLSSLAINRELHARLGIAGCFGWKRNMIMRKVISTTLAGVMLLGLSAGMVGCSDETGSKVEVKSTTPGGTTTETQSLKVKKSGENPPLAPSDTAKP